MVSQSLKIIPKKEVKLWRNVFHWYLKNNYALEANEVCNVKKQATLFLDTYL